MKLMQQADMKLNFYLLHSNLFHKNNSENLKQAKKMKDKVLEQGY